jgi:lysophospholipase L1-like esterase
VPGNVNINYPFGFTPENPWPNNLILDEDEIGIINQVVPAYNAAILTTASAYDYAVVDIHAFFNNIAANGFTTNGLEFTTQYVTGALFSLDGVHPTSQGYAIVANEFIKVINTKYNAQIPLIDVSTIPGSLVFTSGVSMGKYGIPKIPYGALDHVIF